MWRMWRRFSLLWAQQRAGNLGWRVGGGDGGGGVQMGRDRRRRKRWYEQKRYLHKKTTNKPHGLSIEIHETVRDANRKRGGVERFNCHTRHGRDQSTRPHSLVCCLIFLVNILRLFFFPETGQLSYFSYFENKHVDTCTVCGWMYIALLFDCVSFTKWVGRLIFTPTSFAAATCHI